MHALCYLFLCQLKFKKKDCITEDLKVVICKANRKMSSPHTYINSGPNYAGPSQ